MNTTESPNPNEPLSDDALVDETAADVHAPAEGQDELTQLRLQVEELERQREELKSQVLRGLADYQNLARRSRIDAENARQQQTMAIARALLPVADHFDRALESGGEDGSKLREGLRIVRDELTKALNQFGVQPMAVEVGAEFDPTRHEALLRQPVEGLAANHIAAVLQIGYTIDDKTLRPTQVAVTP